VSSFISSNHPGIALKAPFFDINLAVWCSPRHLHWLGMVHGVRLADPR
jgi:hypothetical protein